MGKIEIRFKTELGSPTRVRVGWILPRWQSPLAHADGRTRTLICSRSRRTSTCSRPTAAPHNRLNFDMGKQIRRQPLTAGVNRSHWDPRCTNQSSGQRGWKCMSNSNLVVTPLVPPSCFQALGTTCTFSVCGGRVFPRGRAPACGTVTTTKTLRGRPSYGLPPPLPSVQRRALVSSSFHGSRLGEVIWTNDAQPGMVGVLTGCHAMPSAGNGGGCGERTAKE